MKRNFQPLWSPARVLPVFLSLGKQMCIAACPEGWPNSAVTDQEGEFRTRGPAVALRWSSGASLQCCGAGQPLPPAPLLGWHRPGRAWGPAGSFTVPMGPQGWAQHHCPARCLAGRAELVPIPWHIPGMSEGEKRCPESGAGAAVPAVTLWQSCFHDEGLLCCRLRQSLCTSSMGFFGSFFQKRVVFQTVGNPAVQSRGTQPGL